MNIPTCLPFFNGTRKQNTLRDGSPITIFSPRTQLPPFQIQRPHVADTYIRDIFLVDCDGTETDIGDYFRDSIELITGGYTNGPGTLQAYDTMTIDADSIHLTSIVKTTTAAGAAGMETTTAFAVTEDERFYLEIDLTLTSGVAPKVVITEQGDETTVLSNEVLLVSGLNYIEFRITDTNAAAALVFYNATGDATNYSCDASPQTEILTLTRSFRPTVYEFTSVDYIQYSGENLINPRSLLRTRAWTNSTYDTFTSSDTAITTAIDNGAAAAHAMLPNNGDMELEDGAVYTVYIPNAVINAGAPSFRFTSEGAVKHTSPYHEISAGDNKFDLTVTKQGVVADIIYDGYLEVYNAIGTACNWNCGPIEVRKKANGLLPKGSFYIKITDGTNEWYSEWFQIRDIYENEMSSLVNSGAAYATFETDGTKVISAISAAGTVKAYLATGGLDIANDEVITVVFFLTLNSGQAPYFQLVENLTTVVRSDVVQSSEGINVIELTATKALSVRGMFYNTAATNFSTSEIWVKRQYASDFVKLKFGDTKDLHGKRLDDQTILYQNSFDQECWLNTILNTPGQNTVDIGSEKDGVFIPEKIITQYLYRIVDYVNRSLFHGLMRLPQHDDITIIDEVGNEYTPDTGNITVSMEWGTFDTGTITIEFNDGSFVRTENSTDIT